VKILHVLDHSQPISDGYAFRSHAIIREQRALGWQTAHVTGAKHAPFLQEKETVDGLEFYRTPAGQGWIQSMPAGGQIDVIQGLRRHLRPILAAERPDLIHAHSPCLNGVAAMGLGVPVVYELRSLWEDSAVSSGTTTEGSLRYRASRWLETYVLRRADAVTVICEGLREEVARRGVPADRITVMPNAVDPASLGAGKTPDPAAVRMRHGLDSKTVLGFIGSFFSWEGLSLLIDALPEILRQRSDVRLLLVGSGEEEAALRRQTAELGLRDHVIFAGRVPHTEVDGVYAAIDILVYPRPSTRLTDLVTPLKPLEAMALGKLYVASDCGGHREMVRDRETGMLFKAGDAAALARTVLELVGDPALQQRLRASGPRYIREERTWARVVPRYRAAYELAVGRTVG
jgi:PEP-CTERM/exosortase A-associated glycosyltransferase